jgi:superfamily II DNA or RNA helicase
MMNQLSQDTSRTLKLRDTIIEYLNGENKILVVGDRIQQLKDLHALFPDNSSLCTSKSKPDFTKQIIFGICSIVGTGLDVPHLNVLVFAMPKKNIVQIIGRVFRKQHPIVYIVDPIDGGGIAMGQKRKRMEQYRTQISNFVVVNK